MEKRQTFASLQAGRGIAALLVVLFHASVKVFAQPKYWGANVFGGLFNFGHAGVDFFFVLSGFIIAHAHEGDVGHPSQLFGFIRNRVVRIYPVYWVVLGGFIILTVLPLGFNAGHGWTVERILSSFLLLGRSNNPTVLAVAWTLFHEVAFYIVFALSIASMRAGSVVAGAWIIGIAAAWLGHPFLPTFLGDRINLLFLFGIGAWSLSLRYPRHLPIWTAWAGAILFMLIGAEEVLAPAMTSSARHLMYGAASALCIAALAVREAGQPIRVPAALGVLGAASYSIYLTHFPLLGILAKIHSMALVRGLPIDVVFVPVVAATVALGVAFHFWVEQPLVRTANIWWPRPARILAYRSIAASVASSNPI